MRKVTIGVLAAAMVFAACGGSSKSNNTGAGATGTTDERAELLREVAVTHVAAAEHRLGERVRLGAIEPPEKARHEERGHLVVRDVPGGVGIGERPPFAGVDAAAVPLPFDQAQSEH